MPCSILCMQITDVAPTWKRSCSHVKIAHNFSIQHFTSSLHSHIVHSAQMKCEMLVSDGFGALRASDLLKHLHYAQIKGDFVRTRSSGIRVGKG